MREEFAKKELLEMMRMDSSTIQHSSLHLGITSYQSITPLDKTDSEIEEEVAGITGDSAAGAGGVGGVNEDVS